jgi:hypothetical protein
MTAASVSGFLLFQELTLLVRQAVGQMSPHSPVEGVLVPETPGRRLGGSDEFLQKLEKFGISVGKNCRSFFGVCQVLA